MGMYTELHFNVELKEDTPAEVIELLGKMVKGEVSPHLNKLPSHPLFAAARWQWMLRSDSYYFNADTNSTLRFDKIPNAYYLCIRCNVKNYDNEIEKFVDWIKPYVNAYEGDFLGFSRYKETEEPTLIYMD